MALAHDRLPPRRPHRGAVLVGAVRRSVPWRLLGLGAVTAGVVTVLIASELTPSRRVALVGTTVLGSAGFLTAGLVARARQPSNRVGPLMLAVAGAWLLSALEFSSDARLAFAGVLGGWLWAALVAHLTLAFPDGRLAGRADRAAVVAAYAIATVGQAAWALVADAATFRPAECERCPGPLLSLGEDPGLAQALIAAQRAAAAIVGAAVVGLLIRRWRAGSPVYRRALSPVLLVGGATTVVLAAGVGALSLGLTGLGRALEWPLQAGVVLIPLAFLGGVLRTRFERAVGVSRLVERLEALRGPDHLGTALADAVGDASLSIAYWVPAAGDYVGADGRVLGPLAASPDRAVTAIDIDGRPVAALVHDSSLSEDAGLVRAAGAAAALWLDRERLEAERRAHIVELRESRARLVHAGDAERRRIERDLHDGAQHRLAALLLQIKLERRALGSRDDATETLLEGVERGLADALGELRALAAGILPPVLSDHGLAAAVDELTSRSPIPVAVEAMPAQRLPDHVEMAAYFVIAEALANVCKHARPTRAVLRVTRTGDRVLVEVADDGVGGADIRRGTGIRGLADRVGALDGTLECRSPPGQGTLLRAEIPCAS